MLAWIRRRSRHVRRLASVCTGAFLLAAAGLLDGKRVVTHWRHCDRLAAQFPTLRVERDPIFIEDGGVWTSAGITAGIDLALAFVEADLGHDAALAVARELVVFLKRPGGQAQYSAALARAAERLRVEAACQALSDTARPVKRIAQLCGFGSEETMRRSFHRVLAIGPQAYRERFPGATARRVPHDR